MKSGNSVLIVINATNLVILKKMDQAVSLIKKPKKKLEKFENFRINICNFLAALEKATLATLE
jgi:ribosomal protein L14E/L6E/L27E